MSPADTSAPFTPIPNPYITGNPVRGGKVFFGREDDFAYVRQRLEAERHGIVLLFLGGRRSGKTSIMYQILEGRLGPEFLPVFVDMLRLAPVADDREFFDRLAEVVVERIADERLVPDYYDFSAGNPVIVFDRLLDDIQQLFPDKRLLFLVDEAEYLPGKVERGELSGGVLTYMASILERRKVSFCFTGSPGLTETQGEEWRRLAAKGDHREISFLSPEDTRRLIREPVAGHVAYDEGVVDRIYGLTFGQPFYTQVICTYVVDYLNGARRHELHAGDLDEVVRTIIDNPPPQLMYEWDALGRQEQLALSLLSEASSGPSAAVTAEELAESVRENQYPLSIRSEALHIALESLFNRKILERDEGSAYSVRVDLFRQWIRRSRSIWRLVEDQGERPRSRLRLLAGAAAAVLLTVVGVAVWRLRSPGPEATAGGSLPAVAAPTVASLRIYSEPAGMDVLLDGVLFADRTPALIDSVAPGDHVVELRHVRYEEQRRDLALTAGESRRLDVPMARKIGALSVAVRPEGAVIALEGEVQSRDSTSFAGRRLPTGEYRLTASKAGFVTEERRVTIASGQTETLDIELRARVGDLWVASEPAGAEIYLDGRPRMSTTPYRFEDLPVGTVRVQMRLADYHPVDTSVTIRLGEEMRLTFALRLLPAQVLVRSDPPGAAIYVGEGDSSWGVTPRTLSLMPGSHRIRLVREGYDPTALTRALRPDESWAPEPVRLVAQYGTVHIIKPHLRTVVVDGQERRRTQPDFQLQVGWHELVLEDTGELQRMYVHKDSVHTISFGEE